MTKLRNRWIAAQNTVKWELVNQSNRARKVGKSENYIEVAFLAQ